MIQCIILLFVFGFPLEVVSTVSQSRLLLCPAGNVLHKTHRKTSWCRSVFSHRVWSGACEAHRARGARGDRC